MTEQIPVRKALEHNPDFTSHCLLQVLVKYKDIIPNVPVKDGDMLDIEFKVQGKEFPFQEFMDRLQKHYRDNFEKEALKKARELIDERFMDSVVALEDTAHAARKMFFNRFPELKTAEELDRE